MRIQKINNGSFEEEAALVDVDTNEVIVKGDYYHDKIDEYIAGFIHGLAYSSTGIEVLDTLTVTPDMELFKLCEFYDDGSDESDDEDEFEEDDNTDYEDDTDDFIASDLINEEPEILSPHTIKHHFKIYGESNRLVYCDIIEALRLTRNNEADLFYIDDDFEENIIYSCLGLEDETNNNLLKPFGVYYDDYNKLQILNNI
jgi:hypothetical protein